MHPIELPEVVPEFAHCWRAAGHHLQRQAAHEPVVWLRSTLLPPYFEHLAFRLGNQLYFVRVEDVRGSLDAPGGREALRVVAAGSRGHACLLRMRKEGTDWVAADSGWGLTDLESGAAVDPPSLVTEELVPMTDWEVHDCAVQVVRDHLERERRDVLAWTGNPGVDPSIWFTGDTGPEWVVVRAVRHPAEPAPVPGDWARIAESCARLSGAGHFAAVVLASAEEPSDAAGSPAPLWRGNEVRARLERLVSVPYGV